MASKATFKSFKDIGVFGSVGIISGPVNTVVEAVVNGVALGVNDEDKVLDDSNWC